jgi:RNA ligase (TIGR02306 family)
MSDHRVDVVEIKELEPHDNADALELTTINGWQVVVRKGDFKVGDKAVFIEPDYIVPTDRDEFAFLATEKKNEKRLTAIRLRGKMSYGLLIPLPSYLANKKVGDNVIDELGIRRYVPRVKTMLRGGSNDQIPCTEVPLWVPKFDIENLRRYPEVFDLSDEVIVTEKVHGANARYVFDGEIKVGSRTRWLKSGDNLWWNCLTDDMNDWLHDNPKVCLFGEVYGPVQSLRYGLDEPRFIAFAAMRSNGEFINTKELFDSLDNVPHVPVLFEGRFGDFDEQVIEGDSLLSEVPQIMEGCVIVSKEETRHPEIGRKILKLISNRYWEAGK